jgi:hypothetical protein
MTLLLVVILMALGGAAMALIVGWAVARSEAREREWWASRNTDWIDPDSQ